MAWMILLKKFGPYIAAVLLLAGIWMHGRSVGTAKWHGKYKDSVQEKLICEQEIVRGSSELIALKATIDKQNTAIEEQSAEYQDRVKATQEAAQRILREQASSYQRLLQEASEASSGLRERVRTIEQAEACHEAWLEVTK